MQPYDGCQRGTFHAIREGAKINNSLKAHAEISDLRRESVECKGET